MKVVKRDGRVVNFNEQRITSAIMKAILSIQEKLEADDITLAQKIAEEISHIKRKKMTVEEIQNLIENKLMSSSRKDVARAYITYRYKRNLVRESNTTDKSIKELIDGENEYLNKENSNKNPQRATVQRDYIAGITSTDVTERFLLPEDVLKADQEGILHFHDKDYFLQHIHNCCLINLDDMLQNGTVINGVLIEKPHRLLTATTIATQIITAVTSSQYGGATISLAALAPFVRDSYNIHKEKYLSWGFTDEDAAKYAEKDLKKEIDASVQTFNYQCNSMSTTNGQAPFLSVFMYLNETQEYKKELAMLIEEFLKQRIKGLKNEVGAYITQAFPKLLYVLENDNIKEGDEYYELTKLAAYCTTKRMVPDYISEKKMLELKGDVYACMGCRSFLTPDRFTDTGAGNVANAKNYVKGQHKYYGRLTA